MSRMSVIGFLVCGMEQTHWARTTYGLTLGHMLKGGYADDFDLASTAAVAEGECPAGGERP